MARGLAKAGFFGDGCLLGYDPQGERVEELRREIGLTPVQGNLRGAEEADLILVVVKPLQAAAVVGEMARALSAEKTVVSMAAGVPLAALEAAGGGKAGFLRVMPNTPALVGAGAFAVCAGGSVKAEKAGLVRTMLGTMGLVVEVAEEQMDAATGLSGSGPAFVALMIEAMADGGVCAGLPREAALRLSAQTVLGTGKMVLEGQVQPAVLKDMVASPGGATAAGLMVLEQQGLRAAAMQAVVAAARRSGEMGGRAQDGKK